MKPAIVLLHSSMSSKAQWATLVEQLTPDFRCIPLDLLGYGTAPYPPGAGRSAAAWAATGSTSPGSGSSWRTASTVAVALAA